MAKIGTWRYHAAMYQIFLSIHGVRDRASKKKRVSWSSKSAFVNPKTLQTIRSKGSFINVLLPSSSIWYAVERCFDISLILYRISDKTKAKIHWITDEDENSAFNFSSISSTCMVRHIFQFNNICLKKQYKEII